MVLIFSASDEWHRLILTVSALRRVKLFHRNWWDISAEVLWCKVAIEIAKACISKSDGIVVLCIIAMPMTSVTATWSEHKMQWDIGSVRIRILHAFTKLTEVGSRVRENYALDFIFVVTTWRHTGESCKSQICTLLLLKLAS